MATVEIGFGRTRRQVVTLAATVSMLLGTTACGEDDPRAAKVADSASVAVSPFAGTWLGTLHVPAGGLRVAINISASAGGEFSATLDSPDQLAYGLPASLVEIDGRHLLVRVASLMVEFSGDLAEGDRLIDGTFMQAGQSLPLTLEKQAAALMHARPQDPKLPLPYHSEDVMVRNDEADVDLACTLSWPNGDGPFIAVALLSGSGPQNRDEELFNHRPFAVIADALARAGTAALRCDDRGAGRSSGVFQDATLPDFVQDARAQVAFLATQTHFAAGRIGLLGHSEGGEVAPLVADGNPDVTFLVLLAAPGVRGSEVLISQQRALGEAAGLSAAELDAAEALQRELLELLSSIPDPAACEPKLRQVLAAHDVTGADADDAVRAVNTRYMRVFVAHDPAEVLRRTQVPVLALNGALDLQVLPELNLLAIETALKAAGNTDVTTRVLPELNHLFQHAKSGRPEEYGKIDETISPEVLSLVSDFVRARK